MKQLDPETERIKNHIWLFLFLWVMALIFGAPPLVKYSPHWLVNIAIGVGLGVAALGATILIYIHWPRFRDTVRVGFYEAGRLAFVTISFCCFAAPVLAIGYHIAVFAYEWLKVGHADAASFSTYFNIPSADGWEGVQIIIDWVWQLPIFLPLIVLTPISWFLGSAFAETSNELAKEIEKARTPR